MARKSWRSAPSGNGEAQLSMRKVSRRGALKTGIAAAVGSGASALAGGRALAGQTARDAAGAEQQRSEVSSLRQIRYRRVRYRSSNCFRSHRGRLCSEAKHPRFVIRRLLTGWGRHPLRMRSFRATVASVPSSRSDRKSTESRWATASLSRAHDNAAGATTAFGAEPTTVY